MKYTPKELKGNVNISRASPVKEFFILLSGILGFLVALYVVLGFTIDYVAERLPFEVEQKLGIFYSSLYKDTELTPAGYKLQTMLDTLVSRAPDENILHGQRIQYKVHIVTSPLVNAMALPGGNIIVFSGLIKKTGSENELAFVLAHELGHYAGRDHLRGLGRRLVLMAVSASLLGTESHVTNFLLNSMLNVEMKFSRNQEAAADLWALDLLNERYGHVSGAADFFEKLSQKEKKGRLVYYFTTHPYPEDRVALLKETIIQKGYPEKEKAPLDAAFDSVE